MTRTQTLPKQITSSVEGDDTIISMVKKNMSEHGVTRLKAERVIATLASVDHYSEYSPISKLVIAAS